MSFLSLSTIFLIFLSFTRSDYFDDLGLDYVEPIKAKPLFKAPAKTVFDDYEKENEIQKEPPTLFCETDKWYMYFAVINPAESSDRRDTILTCAGSVLSPMMVLTAAHCCPPGEKYVYVGYVPDKNEFRNKIPVKSTRIHPKYDRETQAYDICILELVSNVMLKGEAELMTLWTKETAVSTEASKNAFFLGYGSNTSTNARHLSDMETTKCLKTSVLSGEVCKNLLKGTGDLEVNFNPVVMFCGETAEMRTSLRADLDSGGPLIVNDKQIGIASYAVGYGNTTSLMIYTKIDAVWDYISPMLRSGGGMEKICSVALMFLMIIKFL